MAADDHTLLEAWRLAGVELHVRVTAPFTLATRAGETYEFVAQVPDFGAQPDAPRGLLVYDYDRYASSVETQLRLMQAAADAGYVAIGANPAAYVPYHPHRYEETLSKLDWLGAPGHEPAWYQARNAHLISATIRATPPPLNREGM